MSRGLLAAWARSERMVGRSVAGEFVIVPLRDRAADLDSVYNLNPVAAFIWQRLDGHRAGHALVREIVEKFVVAEETAAADYLQFVEQLLSIGAVVGKDPAGPG